MRGYTAKVGLRKSRLHFDTLRARQVVRQVPVACECWETDPKYWFTYGDAVEPGSRFEWNPECPAHPPAPFCIRCTSPVCVCGVER